jgi:hypothetical protein
MVTTDMQVATTHVVRNPAGGVVDEFSSEAEARECARDEMLLLYATPTRRKAVLLHDYNTFFLGPDDQGYCKCDNCWEWFPSMSLTHTDDGDFFCPACK